MYPKTIRVYNSPPDFKQTNFNTVGFPSVTEKINRMNTSIRIGFVNRTASEVTIIERNGIPLIIPVDEEARREYRDNVLEIVKVYTFHTKTRATVLNTIKNLRIGDGSVEATEILQIQEQLQRLKPNLYDTSISIEVSYKFKENEFLETPLYIDVLDYVICHAQCQNPVNHPSQSLGSQDPVLVQLKAKSDEKFGGTFLRYVNVKAPQSCKYVNILGVVHCLKAHHSRDMTMRTKDKKDNDQFEQLSEYVEVIYTTKSLSRSHGHGTLIDIEMITIDQADERFGLYDTYDQAEALGKPDRRAELQAMEAQRKLKDLQDQAARDKIEFERKERDASARHEDARRKADREHQEEMFKMKQKYENSNNDRKDWTEMLKFVLGAVTLVGGITLAAMKLVPVPPKPV